MPFSGPLGRRAMRRAFREVREPRSPRSRAARTVACQVRFVAAATASLQAPYDGADLFVGDGLLALLRPLRRVLEDQLSSGARHVISANRRKTVRTVLRRVLLASGPEETEIDQADRRREHLVPAEPGTGQMTLDHLAYMGQRGPEREHPIMLVTISPIAPQVVIPILPPACGIRPHRLDVAGGIRTDPDVLPWTRVYSVGARGSGGAGSAAVEWAASLSASAPAGAFPVVPARGRWRMHGFQR
jgi:hypothetical protein